MSRNRFTLIIVALFCSICIQHVIAGTADYAKTYRFVPSRSTVDISGGFAGVDFSLFTKGKFDFFGPAFGPPTALLPSAYFVNVDAKLFHPLALLPAGNWDLDDTLNLSGLRSYRPSANHYVFRGLEGQGQKIELNVVTKGPLMKITGASKPGCCDFFKYEVDALAFSGPFADFDFDGKIDKRDLDRLMANIGTLSGARFEQGDADGDADVDGDDFLAWQRQVGVATSLSELSFSELTSGVVPEPSTALLACLAVWRLLTLRTSRYR